VVAQPAMDVTSVTIGAPSPRELAAFYARVLGWSVVHEYPPRPGEPPEAGWAQVRPPVGWIGPRLNFGYEAHYTPPVWPSEAGKQQIMEHLDIAVADVEAAVARATGAGAQGESASDPGKPRANSTNRPAPSTLRPATPVSTPTTRATISQTIGRRLHNLAGELDYQFAATLRTARSSACQA
jgi:catechol 2,3-dioxygenase-like lactoylglutathione lyase family enzyme